MKMSMEWFSLIIGGVMAILAMCGSTESMADRASSPGVRNIQAVRAQKPPVLDGRLDDACWQKAGPITEFLSIDSDRPAIYQSFALISYDDSHLYVAVKCLMPNKDGQPVGKRNPHDTYIFSDDTIEIMLDPGYTRSDYYQLAVNAYGSTFDGHRRGAGSQLDTAWDGGWSASTHIGEGYWSLEAAIPFYALGITPGTGSAWGINICRTTKQPDEWSSIGANGAFNNANGFAVLKGIDADLSKYYYQVGPGSVSLDTRNGNISALLELPITNKTGKSRRIKVERWYSDDEVESEVVDLQAGGTYTPSAERLEVEPLFAARTDAYTVKSAPEMKKTVVSNAASGEILALSITKRPWFCEAMRVEVEDPWKKKMTAGKQTSITLHVQTKLNREQLGKSALRVTLTSKETGKAVATKRVSNPSERTKVTLPVYDLPWGAYDVSAVIEDSAGRNIVSSRATATVLPDGRYRIKVLNNLVTELMNTAERGLTGRKEIAFMNPRKGWVFFSVSGNGKVMLDGNGSPMAAETMKLLDVGRHVLWVDGEAERILVRAVPELIYSCHPSQFPWEFLRKDVLPNCNTILGGTSDVEAMTEWRSLGKKWLGFTIAPGHGLGGDRFVPANEYYERLKADEGFRNPLLSGVMVDQIGSSPAEQKIEIGRALSLLASDPQYNSRSYQPWYEGTVFGSDADMGFMRVVLDAGWPFSFYMYPSEQRTEQMARKVIREQFGQKAVSCNTDIPGAFRRAIVTMGYFSDLTTGLTESIDPGVDFKVFMQMHLEALANDPEFFGAYGLLWYYTPYADEESVRWAGRLFRHYAIEGKTSKLTEDPYGLTHIVNPDFEQGMEGWTITEAEPSSVSAGRLAGYGKLQSRYVGGSIGDTFLITKRSSKGPNVFSQEIRNLTPGRVYSMKMVTADYGNIKGEISAKQQDVVSIRLDNVEILDLPGKNTQLTYPNSYQQKLGKFTGDNPAYMNFHWYVFRAKGSTARLTVSDWAEPGNPGGPAGGQIIYNFIEIQPYLEDRP